jgi:iron(III) transport system substrate-binding protein
MTCTDHIALRLQFPLRIFSANGILRKSKPAARYCAAFLLALCGAVLPAAGHAQKVATRDIYMYQGPDREERLIRNARKEGSLTLYTALNATDSGPLVEAFEKKYGIKVTAWRGGGEQLLQRATVEAKAGRNTADVVELGSGIDMMYREHLLEEFFTPHLAEIPAAALPKHHYYAPEMLIFYVLAYNTKLVKPDQVPDSYEDLLLPKWQGNIGMEPGDIDWFGSMLQAMGEEKGMAYFRKLAATKPQLRKGHTLLATIIAAGEVPMSPVAFNYNVEDLKKKGAPIAWKALPLTIGRARSIGLMKEAPHPNAALLYTDFMLSREGQQIVQRAGNVPVSTEVASPMKDFNYELMDPAVVVDNWDKWTGLWNNLFLGGKAEPGKGSGGM